MKFAENNRISHRQLYRQMILAFCAPFLLCLFGKDKILGISGLWATAAALAVLVFYVIFLIRLAPCYIDLRRNVGAWAWIIGAFFLAYVMLTGAFLLSVLETIVPASLLEGVPGKWISFLAVVVCGLGTHKGMQRRGRMAEVSGGVLLVGILVMMALCLGQSRFAYLEEMWTVSSLTGGSFIKSVYMILCAFSGMGLLPFLIGSVEKPGSAGKPVVLAVFTICGILFGMLLLLPAVFGWKRLEAEPYPILPLLAGADLPGNVLARFDVLWMGFILYSLLFSIGSLLHYGHQIIHQTRMGTGRYWMALVIYVLSIAELGGKGIQEYYGRYLGYIFVPGLLLVQLFLALRGKGKRKKKAAAAVLTMTLFLGGCAGVEPEKRMYPLALGIDVEGTNYALTYGMADLPEATGQEKPEEGGEISALTIKGETLQEINEIYRRTQEKYLDMGHLQVLVLGQELIDERRWDEVFKYLRTEPFIGENIYVFRTESPDELMEWQGGAGTSAGEYLLDLLENYGREHSGIDHTHGVTLRQLYHRWYDTGEMLVVPEILMDGDKIQVLLE